MNLQHVVVGGGEHGLGQPLPRLGDTCDLVAGGILEVEVPGPPVLTVERPDRLPTRFEGEADLADHVLLDDRPDLVAGPVGDVDLRLGELRGAGDGEQDVARHVDQLQRVRHELVDTAQEPNRLLERTLPDLADRPDLGAVLVVDRVLVVEFDQLGLLVDHQHRLIEHADTACGGRHPSLAGDLVLDLPGRHPRGGEGRAGRQGVDTLATVIRDVLGPPTAVPVPVLVLSRGAENLP